MSETNRDIELKLQTSQTRQLFIKIEILDQTDTVINEVSGSAVSGNYNIDASSAVRRTCSITFNLESGFLPDEQSVFWINKRFKLYIGLKQNKINDINEDIYWFNKGVYAIKDPSISISISDNTITINGLDKMALYNGDIGGQLPYATMIEVEEGVYAHEAVRGIMLDGGETNLLIVSTDLQIPHKIESAIGDTRCDVVKKLTDLFYNYQVYYNLDGYFVFEQKPTYQSNNNTIINDVVMDFSENQKAHNLIISISREIAYSNVKNKIVVYGGVHDDGYQPFYELVINNENYNTSPYTVEKLGETTTDGSPMYRIYVVQDDTYIDNGVAESENDNMEDIHSYSIQLCKDRAEQEAYLHQQATDMVSITCLPIYSLDVNQVIYLDDEKSGAVGEYVINNISCGLGAGDTMTINANKLW